MDVASELGKIFIPICCHDHITGGDRWQVTDQCCKAVFLTGCGSAAKKVRKGGIGSAMRTLLIFGSAFGPHWSEKVGILASRDKE